MCAILWEHFVSKDHILSTPISQDRIVPWPELRRIIPYSRMTIWRLEQRGLFPRRIRLAPGKNARVGWSLTEIHQYVEDRKAERQGECVVGHSSGSDD